MPLVLWTVPLNKVDRKKSKRSKRVTSLVVSYVTLKNQKKGSVTVYLVIMPYMRVVLHLDGDLINFAGADPMLEIKVVE